MGLFRKKIVLKEEYFFNNLNLDEKSLISLRKEQGFKVKKINDSDVTIVQSEIKDFKSSFKIINKFTSNGNECEFHFNEVITMYELSKFLEQFFKPAPDNIRFISSEFLNPYFSYILPDGDIFVMKGNTLLTKLLKFCIVTKDKIINPNTNELMYTEM